MINRGKKALHKFLFIFFCFLFSIINTYAGECTNNEYKELKELARQIQFQYDTSDLEKTSGVMGFEVYLYNFSNKFYIDAGKWSNINYSGNPQYVGNYGSGNSIKVIVYASSKTNCEDSRLTSITLQLPTYNPYSFRSECINNKNLNVCKKWIDTSDVSEERFLELIRKKIVKEDLSIIQIVLNFIKEYLIFIIIGIVLILTIIIIKIIKDKKKKKIQI